MGLLQNTLQGVSVNFLHSATTGDGRNQSARGVMLCAPPSGPEWIAGHSPE